MIASEPVYSLKLNFQKSEAFLVGGTQLERDEVTERLASKPPLMQVVTAEQLTLPGSPLTTEAIPHVVQKKTVELERLTSRLKLLLVHHAIFLLKNCFRIPKLMYVLRTSPTFRSPDCLDRFDDQLRKALQKITNVRMDNNVWHQATLPVKLGGLGVRRSSELTIPAYLTSVHSVSGLLTEAAA